MVIWRIFVHGREGDSKKQSFLWILWLIFILASIVFVVSTGILTIIAKKLYLNQTNGIIILYFKTQFMILIK